jgi:gamma-glutamyltranspeptidase/glutathione hydrolase
MPQTDVLTNYRLKTCSTRPFFYAENGFTLAPYIAKWIRDRAEGLSRLPATKAIFTKADGDFLSTCDTFRQAALANSLKNVAENGADYIYKGPWAKKFVAVNQSVGGVITEKDLADYEVLWSEPVRGTYQGFDISSHGLPASVGVDTIGALKVIEQSGILDNIHYYANDAETVFWLDQINKLMLFSVLPESYHAGFIKGEKVDTDLKSRLTDETAAALWKKLEAGQLIMAAVPNSDNKHSDAIVAVDKWGNMAVVVHSINALGDSGVYADGISINNAVSIQQGMVAAAGAGQQLPDPTNPTIVFKDGKTYLCSSSMSPALHSKTLFSLINVLNYGKDPKQAIESPYLPRASTRSDCSTSAINVVKREYPAATIEGMKKAYQLPIVVMPQAQTRFNQGLWIGIRVEEDGSYSAGAPDATDGQALAY